LQLVHGRMDASSSEANIFFGEEGRGPQLLICAQTLCAVLFSQRPSQQMEIRSKLLRRLFTTSTIASQSQRISSRHGPPCVYYTAEGTSCTLYILIIFHDLAIPSLIWSVLKVVESIQVGYVSIEHNNAQIACGPEQLAFIIGSLWILPLAQPQ